LGTGAIKKNYVKKGGGHSKRTLHLGNLCQTGGKGKRKTKGKKVFGKRIVHTSQKSSVTGRHGGGTTMRKRKETKSQGQKGKK